MRNIVYTLILLLISATCLGSIKLAPTCNQEMYDRLYKQIITDSMKDDDYTLRNIRIEALRKLCNGQKSSWERGLNVKGKRIITNR